MGCMIIGFSLAYMYSVLYDDSNFCAIFVSLPEETLKVRRRAQPFLDMFALPGMWEPLDRQLSFHRRLWFCFWEFNSRRRYFSTIDMVALFTETLVLGVPGASLAVFTAQLGVVVLLRASLLGTLCLFKPHNYRAGLPIAVAVGVVQLLTAVVYAMYVAANFTNTLRSASRGMLLLSTTVIFIVTLVSFVCFARLKFTTLMYERDIAKGAELDKLPRKRDTGDPESRDVEHSEPLLMAPDAPTAETDGMRPAQDLDFTRANDDNQSDPGELMVLGADNPLQSAPDDSRLSRKFEAMSCISDESVRGLSQAAADAACDMDREVNGTVERSRSAVSAPSAPKPPPGPEVWRLIAMEEALDRQCDQVPIFEDDLL